MNNQRISADTVLLASFSVLSLGLGLTLPIGAEPALSSKASAEWRTQALVKTASEALAHHDAKQAIRLTTAVINADPKNASAFFIRGKARAEYDDSRNALLDLSQGMKLAPNLADPAVYLTMAQAYLQLKEPERALHALQVGNVQQPSLELYKMSASIHNSMSHDKEALLDIEKALKFDPSSRTMLLLRGSIYDHNRDFEHAIKDYSRVIEISTKGKLKDTNWLAATKKRGDDYEKTGRKELARSDRATLHKESSSWETDLFEVAK
ncbi:MAG: hypothetical protein P4L53_27485 [Candidatus Obscuribacterales bacterium]|nr:hypothetical protein [Candidatus Obscuribacterales bacterium]